MEMRLRAIRQQEKEIARTQALATKHSQQQATKAEQQLKVIEQYEATRRQMEALMKQKDDLLKQKAELEVEKKEEAERAKEEKKLRAERQRKHSKDAIKRQQKALDKVAKEKEDKLKTQLSVEENKAKALYIEKMRAAKLVEAQKKSRRQRQLVINELDKVQMDLTETYMKRNTRLGVTVTDNSNAFEAAELENRRKEEHKATKREEEAKTLEVVKSRGDIALKEEIKAKNAENEKLKEDYERIASNLVALDRRRKVNLEQQARKRELAARRQKPVVVNEQLVPEVTRLNEEVVDSNRSFFADLEEKRAVFEKLKTYLVQGDVEPNSFHFSVSLASENNSIKPIDFDLTYTETSNCFEPPVTAVEEKKVSFKDDIIEEEELKPVKPILKKPTFKADDHQKAAKTEDKDHHKEEEEISLDVSLDAGDVSESLDNIDIRKYLEEEEKYLETLKDDYEQITNKEEKSIDRKQTSTKNPPIKPFSKAKNKRTEAKPQSPPKTTTKGSPLKVPGDTVSKPQPQPVKPDPAHSEPQYINIRDDEELVDIRKFVRQAEAEEKLTLKSSHERADDPKPEVVDIRQIIKENQVELSSDEESAPAKSKPKAPEPPAKQNVIKIKGVDTNKPKQTNKEEEELKKQKLREMRAKRMAYKGKK